MFFNARKKESNINWRPMMAASQWEEAKNASTERPVLLFKHSLRCGTSRMALSSLQQAWPYKEEEVQCFLIDVVSHRALSQQIARDTDIRHESPQAILLWQGTVIYHASHYNINEDTLTKAVHDVFS